MKVPSIDEYLKLLRSKGARVISQLKPGADNAAIDDYEAFTKAFFPQELKYLWSCFDGVTHDGRVYASAMYPGHAYPLSVEESQTCYEMFSDLRAEQQEGFDEHFPEGFVEFAQIDAGGYWVNCIPNSPTYGSVYERVLNSDPMMRYAGSLNQFFEFLVEALTHGALFVVEKENDYAGPGDVFHDLEGAALRELGRRRFPGFPAHLEEYNDYKTDWVAA